jgi:hypothetical protein
MELIIGGWFALSVVVALAWGRFARAGAGPALRAGEPE